MGYLQGSGWAWMVGVFFGALNIVVAIIELVLGRSAVFLGLIISILTVGLPDETICKGILRQESQFRASPRREPHRLARTGYSNLVRGWACSSCGSMIPVGAGFCRNCGKIQ